MHLYQIYILPILTYGLCIFSLEEKHTNPLEKFQKGILKQILSLADNTADPVVYILSGAAPVQLEIHRQALSMFGSIIRHPDSAEFELAKRQFVMRDYDSEEWFSYIRRLCCKYGLPTPSDLMDNPPSKVQWKTMYDKQLKEYWFNSVTLQAAYLQKARFLNPLIYNIGKPHTVIRYASNHIRDVQKCTIK